jgi:hypothetical protein
MYFAVGPQSGSVTIVNTRYLLPCRCGRKITVETSQAGQQICCQCGVTQEVPTLRKIVALESVEAEADSTNATTWGTKQKIALLAAAVLVIAVALMAVMVIQRPTLPRRPDLQTLSPLESLKLWEQLLVGPDTSRLPPQQEYRAEIAGWWRWVALDGALAMAGLITMAVALLLPTAGGRKR